MSDQQTPAGWYPQGDSERYWDGSQWTEHRRPLPTGQPQPFPQQPMYYQPPKKSNTLRNVLLVIGTLMVLGIAGCVAVTAVFVNEVDNAIDEGKENDQRPGRHDNPLEIEVGNAFEVDGFEYDAGWTVGADVAGDIDIQNLKVTNNRDDEDGLFAEIKFWKGEEILGVADCTTDRFDVGTKVTVSCFSADVLPKVYDKITINDSF